MWDERLDARTIWRLVTLSGTLAPPIFNPSNGFTYHMQELAFFSWFYGAPSIGIHGWFSDNGAFLQDVGLVCH